MEPRDRYGRVLAWVTSGGTPVNETLLKEGLAKVLTIPPCGLVRANAFKALEKEARDKKLAYGGIAQKDVKAISPMRRTSWEGESGMSIRSCPGEGAGSWSSGAQRLQAVMAEG
jgi:hypothetical protein